MPKNPPKTEGSTGPCWKCGQQMVCVKTGNYQGEDKFQWQNLDGSGHYKKIGAGDKDFACSTGSKFNPPSVAQQLTTHKVNWLVIEEEEQSEDMKQLLAGLKGMRALAYQDAKELHPDMDDNSNVFGQIVNAGITHLIQLAKVKAIKEIKS
jgi:hypothetical protein